MLTSSRLRTPAFFLAFGTLTATLCALPACSGGNSTESPATGAGGAGGEGDDAGNDGTTSWGGASSGDAAKEGSTDAGGCNGPQDCPVPSNECVVRACDAGQCGTAPAASGTPIKEQTPGDCRVSACDGQGAVKSIADDKDLPDDGNACTKDLCNEGAPAHPASAKGTACGAGLSCDGNGACTGCTAAAQCPGADDDCKTRKCTAGECGWDFSLSGTKVASQVSGDCGEVQCDGAGGTVRTVDGTDVPADSNECTDDLCTAGTPSNPASSAGTSCSQNSGKYCDGSGACAVCLVASDCAGTDDNCQKRTCMAGQCGVAYEPAGAVLPPAAQATGDCQQARCDGKGAVELVADDADVSDDQNDCTDDVCSAGASSNPPKGSGTACGNGLKCDGSGQCVGCVSADDCAGTNTECRTKVCLGGSCGFSFMPAGTKVSGQATGDCKVRQCDGAGEVAEIGDGNDVPVDGLECTLDLCTGATPSNPPRQSGTSCSQGGGAVCDPTGACVQCLVASSCPGQDTECQTRTCSNHVCGLQFTAAGTPVSQQSANDCKLNQCDGAGQNKSMADDLDLPIGTSCTTPTCTQGAASTPPKPQGTTCGANMICDSTGHCVGCVTASDCSGTNTECRTKSCNGGACGFDYTAAGTAVAQQTPHDCHTNRCDGAGNIVNQVDDADLPVDGVECSMDVCSSGTSSNPPQASGTACNQSGGVVCNGVGSCVQCTTTAQCASTTQGLCVGEVCQQPSCTDGLRNAKETDVDCGGGTCGKCALGKKCITASDCQSALCTGLVCSAPPVTQSAQLTGYDYFGESLAIDVDTLVVGSSRANTSRGRANVYVRSGGTWTHQVQLEDAAGHSYDYFGRSVALDGDTIVVGAPYAYSTYYTDAGAAYVYVRSGTTWSLQSKIDPNNAQFGTKVAISGDTALISGNYSDSTQTIGRVWVYVRSGAQWNQQAVLTASDGALNNRFGKALAIQGDTAIIGAWSADTGAGSMAGKAYVFTRSGGTWTEAAKLTGSKSGYATYFGSALALDGDTALIGEPGYDVVPSDAYEDGAAYVFKKVGGTWTESKFLTTSKTNQAGYFGSAVALDGDVALIGPKAGSVIESTEATSAYVFQRGPSGWIEREPIVPKDLYNNLLENVGYAVGLSGTTAVVGTPSSTAYGSAFVYELALPPAP